MRAFVEDTSDASVWLLTCSVPNLQLNDMLIVNSHHVVAKLHSNSNIVIFIEYIIRNPDQYRWFADTLKEMNWRNTYENRQ